jgi:hypothetical protein
MKYGKNQKLAKDFLRWLHQPSLSASAGPSGRIEP